MRIFSKLASLLLDTPTRSAEPRNLARTHVLDFVSAFLQTLAPFEIVHLGLE